MLGKTKGCNSSNHQRCFLFILTGFESGFKSHKGNCFFRFSNFHFPLETFFDSQYLKPSLNFDYLDKHLSIKLLGGTDSVKAVDTPVTLVINTG